MSARVRGGVASLSAAQPPPAAGPPIRTGLDRTLPGAREVDLDQLSGDPEQPRKTFDQARLDDLCGSVIEYGLLQPLLVRELAMDEHGDMQYRVIAGGRRLAALRLAQERCADPALRARLRRVPVILARSSEVRIRVLQLLENLQRADLAPLDEAQAYQEILDLERIAPPALAERLHISAQTVRNRLRLLQDQVIADAVRREALTVSAAQEAQKLADEGLVEIYERLRAGETVSVAQVQDIRARLSTAGVINPRRKGQGEPAASQAPARPLAPAAAPQAVPPGGAPPPIGQQPTPEQKVFVADRKQDAPSAAGEAAAPPPEPAGRQGRSPRPTFLRLQEIDAALRNLSLDQASDEEEAAAWLPILRSISGRAARLASALERMAGSGAVPPPTSLPAARRDVPVPETGVG